MKARSCARGVLALLPPLLLAGCAGSSDTSEEAGSSPSATPSSAFLSVPEWDPADEGEHASLEAGTYLVPSSAWSVADFTVAFPTGWAVQYGHVFAQHGDQSNEFGFYAVVVDEIFADSCEGEGGMTETVGPGVDGLVTALLGQAGGAKTTKPESTTLGGYPAKRIDLEIPKDLDLDECQMAEYGFEGLQVWYSEPADKYFVLLPGALARVYVVDVDGQRQVFLAQVGNPRSDEDRAELDTVLDSIQIRG